MEKVYDVVLNKVESKVKISKRNVGIVGGGRIVRAN